MINKIEKAIENTKKEHFSVAVALKDEVTKKSPPIVTASGRGSMAEKILQIAFDNGIKVRQDADLAEILSAIDIDSEIPVEAFTAVAEILNYVYMENNNLDVSLFDN